MSNHVHDNFICRNSEVSDESEQIVRGLLQLDPNNRFTATQTRNRVESLLKRSSRPSSDRAVPEFNDATTTTESTTATPLGSRKLTKSRMVKVN